MNRSSFIPVLLVFIIAIAQMATAIYTPSLALVAQHFSVSEAVAQLTVGINLFGLALSGPLYGPLSDCYGRRTLLLIGMGLFLLGSFLILFAHSIEFLLLFRFLQGIGAGVAVVVGFAVINDLFNEKQSAQVLSYMGMAIALSPGLAPILGGYLAHHYGWHLCFVVVNGSAALLVLLLWLSMPETLAEERQITFSLKALGKAYLHAIQNTQFVLSALIPSSMIGGIWAVMSGFPVLFVSYLDVPVYQYGYYGLSGVMFYVIGTLTNSRLVHRYALKSLVLAGLSFCLISTVSLLAACMVGIKDPLTFQALIYPYTFGLALIIPNATALAFSKVRDGVGTSSSLLGSLQMTLGAVGVFLVGQFFDGSIVPIAAIMLGAGLLSLGLFWGMGE
jgi:MFS transporter, DHA1 family, multidrug resistance protein